MSELEKRVVTARLETREGERPGFEGYAAVFNQPSVDMGFTETVDAAAFARTLAAGPDVLANIQHEGGLATIGRTRNGTLRLETDNVGLRVRIEPPDTQAGRDALTLVSGGYVDQMSFAFRVVRDRWTRGDDDALYRHLLDVELDGGDVAIVTGPAYPQTTVEVRDRVAAMSEGGQAAHETADEEPGPEGRLAIRKRKLDIIGEM